MKYAGKYSLSFFIKILILAVMAGTVLIVAFLPWVVKKYLVLNYGIYNTYARNILLIVLYPAGICAFFIENELRRMFKTLEDQDPFVERNVKSLNIMGILMLAEFVIFIFKIIMLNTIMTMLSAFAIIIIAAFCFVLADVFKQAVIYKQENDLTI